jgi:lipopolysaccharide/colanic/teichoic acid biosynthesis glycosyltransferase
MSSAGAQPCWLSAPQPDKWSNTGRRILDVAIALGGLFCLAPLFFLSGLAIYLESGLPLFFSHLRLGECGRPFRLYKFRKFREDAPARGMAVTLRHDPRLTRVGRILAQTKLDELPQLWNVLKGDMSMVGPRPEVLEFADCFADGYHAVLRFKPGIFGPNQVFLRNESFLYPGVADPEEFYRRVLFPLKARTDLAYFPYRTIGQDITWIVRGVLAVIGWTSMSTQGQQLIDQIETWIARSKHFAQGEKANT